MGTYIDRGNRNFAQALNSTYVDKSGLISVINGTLFTEQSHSCVKQELENAVEDGSWRVAEVIRDSSDLLEATLAGDSDYVAQAIDKAHDENTSILSYNNENSLACVLTIAYICSKRLCRKPRTGYGQGIC